jgi:hypothetical protein
MGMNHISLQAATIICLWQKSHTPCLEHGYGLISVAYVADNGTDRQRIRDGSVPTVQLPRRRDYFFLGGRVFGSYVVLASNIDSLSPVL